MSETLSAQAVRSSTFAAHGNVCSADNPSVGTRCLFCEATDQDLVTAVHAGQKEAFEHFLDRHYALVLRVAWQIVRDEGEAQDIAQETFFQFIRTVDRYDSRRGSPRAWVLAIARSRSLDRRQYLNLRKFYDHVNIDGLEDLIGESARPQYDPPRVIAEAGLDAAFSTLSAPQRKTIELHCIDGLTFVEIAKCLGDAPANIGNYYYRGIRRIRSFLDEQSKHANGCSSRKEEIC